MDASQPSTRSASRAADFRLRVVDQSPERLRRQVVLHREVPTWPRRTRASCSGMICRTLGLGLTKHDSDVTEMARTRSAAWRMRCAHCER
jgi:predicted phosphoadenosine phosphosulfate sulfurtransferase